MRGQWVGDLDGETPGWVFISVDDRGSYYSGSAFFQPSQEPRVPTFARFQTVGRGREHTLEKVPIQPTHPLYGRPLTFEEAREWADGREIANSATLRFAVAGDRLEAGFSTPLGASASGNLSRLGGRIESDLVPDPDVTNWRSFVERMTDATPYTSMYRGQSSTKRLRTAFHRTGRCDLARYVQDDIPIVQHAIGAQVPSFVTLDNPVVVGAFYNLLQHHGLPTPVLDWTYSPFVAAFFAYQIRPRRLEGEPTKVRIFILDKIEWLAARPSAPVDPLTHCGPHVSPTELAALENRRAIPQQALQTITNVDDVEAFVSDLERIHGKSFLRAIDLPDADRHIALRELSLMGITAASLFPGLDGTCAQLKHRLFGYDA